MARRRTLLDPLEQQFDGILGDFFHERRESTHFFFEPQLTEKLILQFLPWTAAQLVRNCHSYRGDLAPPGEQGHDLVKLIREYARRFGSI